MNIRFFIQDNKWYAHLPAYLEQGGSLEDCEMVSGADVWLGILAQGRDSITLKIETEPFTDANRLMLDRVDYGAYYAVSHNVGDQKISTEIWLCPVTLFVFGTYPPIIYYK